MDKAERYLMIVIPAKSFDLVKAPDRPLSKMSFSPETFPQKLFASVFHGRLIRNWLDPPHCGITNSYRYRVNL